MKAIDIMRARAVAGDVARQALSAQELAARRWLVQPFAQRPGYRVGIDAAANVLVRCEGQDAGFAPGQPLNLWMNIPVAADGGVDWLPPVSKAGDYVDLRAEMDWVAVVSAFPQDIVPINDNRPVEVRFTVMADA